jgi:hypothetical protein
MALALPSGDEQCIVFSQLYATCSIDTRIAGEQCCGRFQLTRGAATCNSAPTP